MPPKEPPKLVDGLQTDRLPTQRQFNQDRPAAWDDAIIRKQYLEGKKGDDVGEFGRLPNFPVENLIEIQKSIENKEEKIFIDNLVDAIYANDPSPETYDRVKKIAPQRWEEEERRFEELENNYRAFYKLSFDGFVRSEEDSDLVMKILDPNFIFYPFAMWDCEGKFLGVENWKGWLGSYKLKTTDMFSKYGPIARSIWRQQLTMENEDTAPGNSQIQRQVKEAIVNYFINLEKASDVVKGQYSQSGPNAAAQAGPFKSRLHGVAKIDSFFKQ